ncbi:MAG: class I SAM-dependent methyltransferase [Geobacteraceae bacterium]|nr:class I SAM-dependent methyltransferase [Geobacteraceae bacterium]
MPSPSLFYRYYDTLFSSKGYAGEITAILGDCSMRGLPDLAKILEVGCGTGNHTEQLAKLTGAQVLAVDTDPEMLALARMKAKQFIDADVTFASVCTPSYGADLAVALFNVVNYLCEGAALERFFTEIASSLHPQGLFFFDCWNGIAALRDPPGSKSYVESCSDGSIVCHLTSQTDALQKITTMNYRLELQDKAGKTIVTDDYPLRHRLWTPDELKAALAGAGFSVEVICLPFKFDQAASGDDWKIMFICRKA